jgi:hypothetical protein
MWLKADLSTDVFQKRDRPENLRFRHRLRHADSHDKQQGIATKLCMQIYLARVSRTSLSLNEYIFNGIALDFSPTI